MLKSIRTKLIVTSISVVSLVIILQSLATITITQKDTLTTINQQINLLMDSYINEVNEWLQSKRNIAKAVYTVHDKSVREAMTTLSILKNGTGGDVYYIGFTDGGFLAAATESKGSLYWDTYDPRTRPWYVDAAKSDGMIVVTPYIDVRLKELVVTLAEGIREGAQLKAVTAVDIKLTNIIQLINALKPTPSSYAYIVTEQGLTVTHSNPDYTLKPLSEHESDIGVEDIIKQASNETMLELNNRKKEGLLFTRKIPDTSWYLVIVVDRDEATANIKTLVQMLSFMTVSSVLIIMVLLAVAITRVTKGLIKIRNAMDDIVSGDGDLTKRLIMAGQDELAQIANAFNRFVDKLAVILRDIAGASESVKVLSAEIANGNLDLSNRTESQASSLEETSAAMEELTATVKHNDDNASQANQMASSASTVAKEGGDAMTEVIAAMELIRESSVKIANIISVIDGIAFQTNILALNAAVEAARAGEQGRGFAVVASEVRNLAKRSSEASKEISDLINRSVVIVAEESRLVEKAGNTMADVVTRVKNVTDIVSEISASSREQSQGISEISKAVISMDEMTQQNAALVEQSAAAAASLKEQSEKLAQMVGVFKLDK